MAAICPTVIHHRARHASFFTTGRTAPETGRTTKAAAEMVSVYEWLQSQGVIPLAANAAAA